jgi:hypothetical protein
MVHYRARRGSAAALYPLRPQRQSGSADSYHATDRKDAHLPTKDRFSVCRWATALWIYAVGLTGTRRKANLLDRRAYIASSGSMINASKVYQSTCVRRNGVSAWGASRCTSSHRNKAEPGDAIRLLEKEGDWCWRSTTIKAGQTLWEYVACFYSRAII